jgi:hypothetical protein
MAGEAVVKATDPLTITQLVQRLDELRDVYDQLYMDWPLAQDIITSRIEELTKAVDTKMKENTFNRGVVTPLPPDHLDVDNQFVVTPKAPAQIEREREAWEKSLDP